MTRWVLDGLRLVSLAQARAKRAAGTPSHASPLCNNDRVQTFLLKKNPFTNEEIAAVRETADSLGFNLIYAPRCWRARGADAERLG